MWVVVFVCLVWGFFFLGGGLCLFVFVGFLFVCVVLGCCCSSFFSSFFFLGGGGYRGSGGFLLLLKNVITQIQCQGSIKYLLLITSKSEERAKICTLLHKMATLIMWYIMIKVEKINNFVSI